MILVLSTVTPAADHTFYIGRSRNTWGYCQYFDDNVDQYGTKKLPFLEIIIESYKRILNETVFILFSNSY